MLHPQAPRDSCRHGGIWLRKYRIGDGAGFFALTQRNAQRLAPHFPGTMQAVRNEVQAARYVRQRIRDWDERLAYFFAVAAGEDPRQIGQVRFKTVDWEQGKAEIAYFIDQDLERRRLMTDALAALVAIGFDELGLTRLYAHVAPTNARSRRLLERGGFAAEAQTDVVRYALNRARG